MPDFAVERDDLVSVYLYSLNQIHANMKKLKTRSWGEDDKHNYHISYLGTAPWAQKKGLGSELIRMSMERARKEGREVSLSTHTEENVGISPDCSDSRPTSTSASGSRLRGTTSGLSSLRRSDGGV